MFKDCQSLIAVVILNSVSYIGDHVFSGCAALENIEISESMTKILDNAFYSVSLKTFTIPPSITKIGN